MDALDRLLGTYQGRIEPNSGSAFDGDFVFALGTDLEGSEWDLDIGDKVELSQSVDVTSIKLVRFKARLRSPASRVPGTQWVLRWYVGAVVQGLRGFVDGEERDFEDGAFDVSQLSGAQTLKFVLSLEVGP